MHFERKSDTTGLLGGCLLRWRLLLGRRVDARRFGRLRNRHRDGDQDACRIDLGFFGDVVAPDDGAISISSREHVTGEIGDIVAWPHSDAASYDALCAENDTFSEGLAQALVLLEGGISHDEPSLPARVKAPIVALVPWQIDDFFSISAIVNQ